MPGGRPKRFPFSNLKRFVLKSKLGKEALPLNRFSPAQPAKAEALHSDEALRWEQSFSDGSASF